MLNIKHYLLMLSLIAAVSFSIVERAEADSNRHLYRDYDYYYEHGRDRDEEQDDGPARSVLDGAATSDAIGKLAGGIHAAGRDALDGGIGGTLRSRR